jgi:hypothetical protein
VKVRALLAAAPVAMVLGAREEVEDDAGGSSDRASLLTRNGKWLRAINLSTFWYRSPLESWASS